MFLKLSFCFGGIFSSYLINGIMVELLTKKYGGEIYKHYFLMVLIPVICNAFFAKCSLLSRYYFKSGDNIDQRNGCIPKQYYVLMSVLFLVSMLCANASLAYISFPTQLIMKSSKPISIVLCGLIFVRKAYSYHRLISALIIVISVSMFMYEQYTAQPHSQASHPNSLADTTNSKFGIFLVLCSLTFDGLLATVQDRLRLYYTLQTYEMMYYVNLCSTFLLTVALFGSRELLSFLGIYQKHKDVIVYLFLLGISSSLGQNFIYYTLTQFGPLTVSIMTTFRKFCNVLISVLFFTHVFTFKLWILASSVFFGVVLDIWAQQQVKV